MHKSNYPKPLLYATQCGLLLFCYSLILNIDPTFPSPVPHYLYNQEKKKKKKKKSKTSTCRERRGKESERDGMLLYHVWMHSLRVEK